jgi:hypothetical protein
MSDEINYKHFSPEEDELYTKHITMIRSNIGNGLKFDLACEFIAVEDRQLKGLIIDDALKIEIAELHYGKGLALPEVSKKLGVSMERLLKANSEMMEDVVNTAAEIAQREPGKQRPTTH